uniref:Endoplasmic reticulum membrane sensor NFE2L1 n=1 Tax=Tetraodon nigroviridis TaxID=99883 RepID=H3CBV1_TETNG
MQYPKKYLTEGLIQMTILLSLCGLLVDVGLEPYLPSSWHERILGPTSALTQTQFHNLRNRLEDGHGLHPKHVDLDSFFTAHRLLGWVRSLDRLQVPQAELETWLVQREHDPLPAGLPVQASHLAREPPGIGRVQLTPSSEFRPSPATLHELADDEEEKKSCACLWDMDISSDDLMMRNCLLFSKDDVEHVQFILSHAGRYTEQVVPARVSEFELGQEKSQSYSEPGCLSLGKTLGKQEESFAVHHQDDGGYDEEDTPHQHDCFREGERPAFLGSVSNRELTPNEQRINPFLDLELHWQDLLAIMEPQARRIMNVGPFHHSGSLGPPDQWEEQPALLPLTPTEELEEHRSAFSSGDTAFSLLQNPPDLMDLFPQDPSQDFFLGFSADDNMNLLTRDLEDTLDDMEDEDGLPSPLNDLMEDTTILDEIRLLDLALEEGFGPEMAARLDGECDAGSDSGLSLDFSHSQASPSASEDSADESLFSEDAELCDGPQLEMEVTIGAVGGSYPNHAKQAFCQRYQEEKLFNSFPWPEHVDHDHTYNQSPSLPVGKMSTKQTRPSVGRHSAKPYHHSPSQPSDNKMWSHDERRARTLKVPFSNELIVNLPVEEFNELLASFQLNEEQLALIKDIRRRGKNKVAAQNCRKRKMDVLLGLNDEVSSLMSRRSRLLREKREAMRNLQEMKHRLKTLYQEVFSRLRDEEGRPLNPAETELRFQPDGSVTVASSRRGGATPLAKSNRKQANKKK